MLARTQIKGRQILVDKDPSLDMSHLQELMEHMLVAKANEVLSMMKTKLTDSPGTPRAVGAKKLHNGRVVFELSDNVMAQWVRKEKATFTSTFGSTSVVRMRSILVIVEYVPMSHSPDMMLEHRRIERDSGLTEDSLLATRWIKPMQRHAPGQQCAHLIACFQTPEAANLAMREGIVIAGKRVWAQHMQKEPRRCLCCQSLTARHVAAKCNQPVACGTCGKDH